VLAGGALVAAIAALWSSLRALFGERPMSADEAFAFAAPTGEDEQKRAVLRALQDLDYERNVGKISEEDYCRLRDRHRAEASRLLELEQQADEPLRRRVEQLVAEHLAHDEALRADDEEELDDELDPHVCAECGTRNDEDALFCKKCGHELGGEAAAEDEPPEGSESEP
jgi:ribosomal protein L40E